MARLTIDRPRIKADSLRLAPPPKTALPYYLTPEHRAWSKAVIARAHGICEMPGCGRRERRMFADHIVEVGDDPSRRLDPANGQCLCGSCHTRKTAAERDRRHARR
jgi:hypothetical protein